MEYGKPTVVMPHRLDNSNQRGSEEPYQTELVDRGSKQKYPLLPQREVSRRGHYLCDDRGLYPHALVVPGCSAPAARLHSGGHCVAAHIRGHTAGQGREQLHTRYTALDNQALLLLHTHAATGTMLPCVMHCTLEWSEIDLFLNIFRKLICNSMEKAI